MNKKIIIMILILILVGIILFFYFNLPKRDVTGAAVEENIYSYTKAICYEDNYCQDYEIHCRNRELVDITPISGAAVQHQEDWEDPRDNETIEKLC